MWQKPWTFLFLFQKILQPCSPHGYHPQRFCVIFKIVTFTQNPENSKFWDTFLFEFSAEGSRFLSTFLHGSQISNFIHVLDDGKMKLYIMYVFVRKVSSLLMKMLNLFWQKKLLAWLSLTCQYFNVVFDVSPLILWWQRSSIASMKTPVKDEQFHQNLPNSRVRRTRQTRPCAFEPLHLLLRIER